MHLFSAVKDKGLRIKDSARSANHTRGFTILFAVLIGSLLFSLGLAIAHLSIKEIVLSAAGKQSETAFFAADTGIECALYWDLRVHNTFPDFNTAPRDPDGAINCNGGSVTLNFTTPLPPEAYPKEPLPGGNANAATTTFRLVYSTGCADITVGKTRSQGPGTPGRTVIESRGRSDCGTEFNPARVERALRVRY